MKLPPDVERACLQLADRIDGRTVSASVPYQQQMKTRKTSHKAKPTAMVETIELVAVEVRIPVRVKSSEQRTGSLVGAGQAIFDAQGQVLALALSGLALPELPVVATWTKLGGGRLDGDNLAGSFKKLRDALAARYGVDDREGSGVAWGYEQRPGGAHGVLLRIERTPAAGPPPR
jgi:hypothetical protein